MEFYDFQTNARKIALKAVSEGKSILLSSPTGSGKSIIGIDTLHSLLELGLNTYFMSKSKEVLWGIEEKGRELFDLKLNHLLWTPNRLIKRLKSGKVKKPDLIIVDEAHHLHAPGWSQFKDIALLIGLTATALRGVNEQVVSWKSYFQVFYSCISIAECIIKGILVPFYIPKENLNKIKTEDTSVHYIRKISQNFIEKNIETMFRDVMKSDDTQPRPTIFSTPNITSSLVIKNYFGKRGIKIAVISKDTGKNERAKFFDLLKQNKIWLAAIDILTEGIDIPEISRVVSGRPTISPIPYIQLIGRGLRPIRSGEGGYSDDKLDCEIIDYSDNLKRFLPILDKYLGLSLIETTINNVDCFVPNLKDVRHPTNEYKSFKFILLNSYSKINLKVKRKNFIIDVGFIEMQLGKKRWYVSCKENALTKHFYYDRKNYTFNRIDIVELSKYKITYVDYKIANKDFDEKFNYLLNKIIRLYAKPFSTIGLLFGIAFLESSFELLKKYKIDKFDEILYYLNEEVELIQKWRCWLDLIPSPSETESVFFKK